MPQTRKKRFPNQVIVSHLILVVIAILIVGCAPSPNLYRVNKLAWSADSIVFVLNPIDTGLHTLPSKVEINCLSCNVVDSYWNVTLDSVGAGAVYIPEANTLVTARLKVHANRLDTTVVLKERTPKDAEAFYKLSRPLMGRVMLVQLGILYSDSLQSGISAQAEPGDELNIFGEAHGFYLVQHPDFTQPLYLLKNSAVRLY